MKSCVRVIFLATAMLLAHQQSVSACDACIRSKAYVANSPATLIEGLTGWSHPVTTAIPQAQCFFDQGIMLCFGFNHYEAIRSFKQALTLDSNLAMAHWGIAYALGGNYNIPIDAERMREAFDQIQRAKQLAIHVSPREQAYIGALALRYSIDTTISWGSLDSQYALAMTRVSKQYPDDPDAAVFSAEARMNLRPWKLWSPAGVAAEGTEAILADLQSVLRRYPSHPGAAHFFIHAIEASPLPERGLTAAIALESGPRAAGHLVHMPSHIYIRTGRYKESVDANRRAVASDQAYLNATPRGGLYEVIYFSHNLHFLSVSASMMGDSSTSLSAARQVDELLGPLVAANPMAEGITGTVPLMLVRFERWKEILATPLPDSSLKIMNLFWRYARGRAHAALGNTKEATKELGRYEQLIGQIPEQAMVGAMNSARSVAPIAYTHLKAAISIAQNKQVEATQLLKQAVSLQDGLTYDEPEGWYIPVRESYGAQLVRTGAFAEAAEVFRADLAHHPRNGRSLFGLAQALKGLGDSDGAALIEREFADAWKEATITLSLASL